MYREILPPDRSGDLSGGIVLLPFLPSLVKTDIIPPDVDLYVLYLLHLRPVSSDLLAVCVKQSAGSTSAK